MLNECEKKFRRSINIHAVVMMIQEVAQDCWETTQKKKRKKGNERGI